MESSTEVEARAGAWLCKRDSGDWSDEDQRCFTQWLDASTANRVAFLRLEAAWEEALRLQALGGGSPPGVVPSPDDWQFSPFFDERQSTAEPPSHPAVEQSLREDASGNSETNRGADVPMPLQSESSRDTSERMKPIHAGARLKFASAASVLLAVAAGVGWYLWPQGPSYSTPVGGIASVPMSEGSKIMLNTDSAIRVAVTAQERNVRLDQGEAFFEVAKDPARPFVVSAGSKRVIAVGTKFSVRRIGDEVNVFVTEGKVRVEDRSSLLMPRDRKLAAAVEAEILVAAGGIARAGDAGIVVHQNALPEIEDYLSWRSGYLVFREVPLTDAVAEFNRYNERKIVIEDPKVAAIRLSGKIRSTNSEAFLRLLEGTFPIRAERTATQVILTDTTNSQAGG